ncbi:MAG TPA: helix-turn-helix domain-containing protein [Bacteroidales bacterium]
MNLREFLNANNNIKIEIRLSDLIDFANYLLNERSNSRANTIQVRDIGDISLAREVTGLSNSTIYTKVSKGKIPFMKKGGKLFFSRVELTQWIQSGRVYGYDELNQFLK